MKCLSLDRRYQKGRIMLSNPSRLILKKILIWIRRAQQLDWQGSRSAAGQGQGSYTRKAFKKQRAPGFHHPPMNQIRTSIASNTPILRWKFQIYPSIACLAFPQRPSTLSLEPSK